jgi:hypothetical protein
MAALLFSFQIVPRMVESAMNPAFDPATGALPPDALLVPI